MQRIMLILFIYSFSSLAAGENLVEWGKLARLNSSLTEQKARVFINSNKPELQGVEVKWVQTTLDFSKSQGAWLTTVFLHQNSFKPIKHNKTLSTLGGVKYYMEFVHVEFSSKGEPVKIRLKEVLLTNDKESSEKAFYEVYDSF